MSDHARFRILDTHVTLKDLKVSERLLLDQPKSMDKYVNVPVSPQGKSSIDDNA